MTSDEKPNTYADALAKAATAAMRAAVANDDAALLDAVAHMSPGERLNVFRAARRLGDFCGATAENHPNPNVPPLFALLVQRYEAEWLLVGVALIVRHVNLHPKARKRVDFVRNSILRQFLQQGVDLSRFPVPR